MDVNDPGIYLSALAPIAGVAVVLWTGGLIVLQIKDPASGNSAHHLANAAMACAAYAFLVPLLGLLANRTELMVISGAGSMLYLLMTIGNVRSVLVGMIENNRPLIWSGAGYLAPTVSLIILVFFPKASFIAWSSATLIFASYLLLSALARTPKA